MLIIVQYKDNSESNLLIWEHSIHPLNYLVREAQNEAKGQLEIKRPRREVSLSCSSSSRPKHFVDKAYKASVHFVVIPQSNEELIRKWLSIRNT